jgi:hypothetical protein
MTDLKAILEERGKRYGDFALQARVAQSIKEAIFMHVGAIDPVIREALEMDATKTSRIVCGDPHYKDNWIDKAGYATRVAEYLERGKK